MNPAQKPHDECGDEHERRTSKAAQAKFLEPTHIEFSQQLQAVIIVIASMISVAAIDKSMKQSQ